MDYIQKRREHNRERFPCQVCRHFPSGEHNPAWKHKPPICKKNHAMKHYFPPCVTWDIVLDDKWLFCGYVPVEHCNDFEEIEYGNND